MSPLLTSRVARSRLLNSLLPALRRPASDVDVVLKEAHGLASVADAVRILWRRRLDQLEPFSWLDQVSMTACRQCTPPGLFEGSRYVCGRWRICPWCFSRVIGGGLLNVLTFSSHMPMGALAVSSQDKTYEGYDAAKVAESVALAMRDWRDKLLKKSRSSFGYWGFGSLEPVANETQFRLRIFTVELTLKPGRGGLVFPAYEALANVDRIMAMAAYPVELLQGASAASVAGVLTHTSSTHMRFSGGSLRGLPKKLDLGEPCPRTRPYEVRQGKAEKPQKVTIVGSPEKILWLKQVAAAQRVSLTAAVWGLIDQGIAKVKAGQTVREPEPVAPIGSLAVKPVGVSDEFAKFCSEAMEVVSGDAAASDSEDPCPAS